MISSYSFENYKAFGSGRIEIRPITIFIGANSSGKSSVTHLPLLLTQTAMTAASRKGARRRRRLLDLNGPIIQMGDGRTLLSNRAVEKDFSFAVEVPVDDILLSRLREVRDIFNETVWETFRYYYNYIREHDRGEGNELKDIYPFGFSDLKDEKYRTMALEALFQIQNIINKKYSVGLPDDPTFKRYSRSRRGLVFRSDIKSSEDYIWSKSFIDYVERAKSGNIEIRVSTKYNDLKKDFAVASICISLNGSTIFNFQFNDKGEIVSISSFNAEFDAKARYFRSMEKMFNFSSSVFDLVKGDGVGPEDPLFPQLVCRFLEVCFERFRSSFSGESFSYIGPLRDVPRKYYYRGDHHKRPRVDVDFSLVDVLSEDPMLLNEANAWLGRFNTRINVHEKLEDVFRIGAVRNETDIDLDISNIGFGVSQVLPIIVQVLMAPPESITIIEQPEVHLHPNMQSMLADLFLEAIDSGQKKESRQRRFIIETHSTTLLRRLRLRIAQKKVAMSDVSIYSFEISGQNVGNITEVEILENGLIDWPSDFVDEELKDLQEFSRIASEGFVL